MSVVSVAIITNSKVDADRLSEQLPHIHLVLNGKEPMWHSHIKIKLENNFSKPAAWNEVFQRYQDKYEWIFMANPLFSGYSPDLLKKLMATAKELPRLGGISCLLPDFKDPLFHKQGGFMLRPAPYVLPVATLMSTRCFHATGGFNDSLGEMVYNDWCARASAIGWRFMVHEGLEILTQVIPA